MHIARMYVGSSGVQYLSMRKIAYLRNDQPEKISTLKIESFRRFAFCDSARNRARASWWPARCALHWLYGHREIDMWKIACTYAIFRVRNIRRTSCLLAQLPADLPRHVCVCVFCTIFQFIFCTFVDRQLPFIVLHLRKKIRKSFMQNAKKPLCAKNQCESTHGSPFFFYLDFVLLRQMYINSCTHTRNGTECSVSIVDRCVVRIASCYEQRNVKVCSANSLAHSHTHNISEKCSFIQLIFSSFGSPNNKIE